MCDTYTFLSKYATRVKLYHNFCLHLILSWCSVHTLRLASVCDNLFEFVQTSVVKRAITKTNESFHFSLLVPDAVESVTPVPSPSVGVLRSAQAAGEHGAAAEVTLPFQAGALPSSLVAFPPHL